MPGAQATPHRARHQAHPRQVARAIYSFGDPKDVRAVAKLTPDDARALLGGKGAGLFEMSRLGLRVPPGFTVTTAVCRAYFERKERRHLTRSASTGAKPQDFLAREVLAEFLAQMRELEEATGRKFADPDKPLLVSVRSGSQFSMPGMMDTILNLGLNDVTIRGLEALTQNPRFAWDCYRRFVAMFSNVVKGIDKDHFEAALRSVKSRARITEDRDISTQSLQRLVAVFKEIYHEHSGSAFPESPAEQLRLAVTAVFESWRNPRAIAYRRIHRLPENHGTACTVQAMVFGNMGDDCATGVGFTRDPRTGERRLFGEFLANAQGEDVVAGTRTPTPLENLKTLLPKPYAELTAISRKLERRYRDVQDLEFTIERGRLYMLQTRTAKRSARAAMRTAVDMVREGLITPPEAVRRVSPRQLDELLRPVFDRDARKKSHSLARGLPAGPGAASGLIAFSADRAEELSRSGPVILVRPETNPDDIHGMAAAAGILTQTGGLTSHAAVVGRGLGKVCVVGCEAVEISETRGILRLNGHILREGSELSLDGFTGDVIDGRVPTMPSEILQVLLGQFPAAKSPLYRDYEAFMGWVDKARRLEVRANADTPADADAARALGASGIGLCRTEHMFFQGDRIPKMLAVIIADNDEDRYRALQELFPLQKEDFKRILRAMGGEPVTIRTLDPPLHEFLPRTKEDAQKRCDELGFDLAKVWGKTLELREANPMLGHRGCRLGITYPEITQMQARAVYTAAAELAREGIKVRPEIMIPLVGHVTELRHQRALVAAVAEEVFARVGARVPVVIGTMIEVPRAAVTAGEIAPEAEFFSFGTNDLTQMTLGFSRDDYGRFIRKYMEVKILRDDPFSTLDSGVGEVIRLAVDRGRAARADLKIGVCGEHGGDPASIAFFYSIGADYVSTSPYRVPVARLAAAQAALSSC